MATKAGKRSTTDVYIKLPTGKNVQIDMPSSATVKSLCEKLAMQEEVDEACLRLKYQGKFLNKSHTLQYLGVRAETILKAETIVPESITVIVKFADGRSENYTVRNTDSLADLQQKIGETEHVPAFRVVLKNEGRQLHGTCLLDVGITNRSVVKAEIKPEAKSGAAADPDPDPEPEMDQEMIHKVLTSFDNTGRRVEVAFSFDTTGSMYSYLGKVRRKLRECCTRLIQDIPSIRISLIAHGDYCDQSTYVVRSIDLTSDVQRLVDFADNVPRTSGGDSPECYEWTLRKAQLLDWSEDSAKALVVIGDCEPHPPSYTDQLINWKEELNVLIGMGVKVYGVKAGSPLNNAALFYHELAERSGGCFLKLGQFDIITDMFLAVCYRESSDDQLEAFEQEIEDKGEMTEEKKEMFKQLEETEKTPKRRTQRYLAEDWWDPTLDHGSPRYSYIASSDKWVPYGTTLAQSSVPPRAVLTGTLPGEPRFVVASTPLKRFRSLRRKKKGCSLM